MSLLDAAVEDGPWDFALYRHTDISGVSGEGVVAYGSHYRDGSCSTSFVGKASSINAWVSLDRAREVHCHGGFTEIVWLGHRVLVTGSRTWTDRAAIEDALDGQLAEHGRIVVVHGRCETGADAIAAAWAQRHAQAREEPHEADWYGPCCGTCRLGHRRWRLGRDYCVAAGNYRNQHMVDLGADVCLAFNRSQSTGTADCVRRAEAAGIYTVRSERAA